MSDIVVALLQVEDPPLSGGGDLVRLGDPGHAEDLDAAIDPVIPRDEEAEGVLHRPHGSVAGDLDVHLTPVLPGIEGEAEGEARGVDAGAGEVSVLRPDPAARGVAGD